MNLPRIVAVLIALLAGSNSAFGGDEMVRATLKFINGSTITGTIWYFRYECLTPLTGNPGLFSVTVKQDRALHLSLDGQARSIPADRLKSIAFSWTPQNDGVSQDGSRVTLTTGEVIRLKRLVSGIGGCDKIELSLSAGGTAFRLAPRGDIVLDPLFESVGFQCSFPFGHQLQQTVNRRTSRAARRPLCL